MQKEIPDPSALRECYRNELNWVIQKYYIATGARLAHFLGKSAVESARLACMLEASSTHLSTNLAPQSGGIIRILGIITLIYLEDQAEM